MINDLIVLYLGIGVGVVIQSAAEGHAPKDWRMLIGFEIIILWPSYVWFTYNDK